MNILFPDMPQLILTSSIFLAGPTPRKTDNPSWRPDAIAILEKLNYKGTVLVPERRDWSVKFDYLDQVEWEESALASATAIVFWVPRKAPDMLALTTNVEFGRWIVKRPGRITYGRPNDAENVRYLDWLYKKEKGEVPYSTLEDTLHAAIHKKYAY